MSLLQLLDLIQIRNLQNLVIIPFKQGLNKYISNAHHWLIVLSIPSCKRIIPIVISSYKIAYQNVE